MKLPLVSKDGSSDVESTENYKKKGQNEAKKKKDSRRWKWEIEY